MTPGLRLVSAAALGPADLLGEDCELDNDALLARAPTLAARYRAAEVAERYGVERRQWVRGTELTECDLAAGAAGRALGEAGLAVADLDLLVATTSTPSRVTSSLAGRLAKALGATCPSFDVRAGGAGALMAWRAAERWLADPEGAGGTALVVATETISPWLDLEAEGPAALLFADGAAALVLASAPGAGGLLDFTASTSAPAGRPFSVAGRLPPDGGPLCFQTGDRTYARAMEAERTRVCGALGEAHAERMARGAAPLEHFYPFAPTLASARSQARALGIDEARTHTSLELWGCPGAAGPWIALASRELPEHSTLAFAAVGGGVHSAAMTWTQPRLEP